MIDIQVYGYISKVTETNIEFNVFAIHNNGLYMKGINTFAGYTYIITEYGYIYRNKQMENTWEQIPGLAIDITADKSHNLYVISKENTS